MFSPDIWSKAVLRATESNLVIAKSVNREFESDATVGKTVKVASIGNLAARAKAENTAITYETVAETATTITLNIWSYAALGIEDIVKVQSSIDLQNEYQRKLGYAVAKDIDTKLAADFAGFSQVVGTLGTAATDANVLAAIKLLDDADVPQDDRFFVMTPAEKVSKLALDRWSNALYVGTSQLPVKNGQLGDMYGLNLMVTTQPGQASRRSGQQRHFPPRRAGAGCAANAQDARLLRHRRVRLEAGGRGDLWPPGDARQLRYPCQRGS